MNEFSNNTENEKSPLDALKDRIKSIQSGETADKKPTDFVGFVVDTDEEAAEADVAKTQETAEEKDISNPLPPAPDFIGEEDDTPSNKSKLSFLKRMRRFTTNDKGEDALEEMEKPSYELETVDEILKTEEKVQEEDEKPAYELETVDEILGIDTEDKSEDAKDTVQAEEDREPEEIHSDEKAMEEPAENIKGYISDIDKPEETDTIKDKPATSDTATIRFTPVTDTGSDKPVLKVETITNQFDISGEFTERPVSDEDTISDYEEDDFDTFVPKEEINDRKDEKLFLHKFAIKKRNLFLSSILCGVLLFVLLIFLMPSIYASFYSGSSALLIASTAILLVMVLLNCEMFTSFAKVIKGEPSFDLCAALASLSTLALSVFSCIKGENCFTVIVVCAFMLLIRIISRFYDVSIKQGNLKIISVQRPKKAVSLINDDPTTIVMAKNSIEGKVMIATSRQTDRVADFMKYSSYKPKTFEKSSILIAVSLSLAVVAAIIAGLIKHSVTESLYVSSAILCAAAMPVVFLLDVLPLRSAATRLNRIGAMLNGYAGADKINQANAVVIKTEDIFPHGSVVLKDMKVLANNNVDDIILRAASLTDAVSSPLSNIFKQIAKTNAAYDVPPSDTVKYEKRLGISGWVDDKLMFIGNRTLLQAHGIEVPDLEYDREILRKGFFPVYVATDNKACLLLVIKYKVNHAVTKQLKSAADLGITLLVENTDPNVTNEMICDYFDLYEDSVLVMNVTGANAHKEATMPCEETSAPAAFRGTSMSLLQIMCSAARIKKSNILLTVLYVIAAVIGTIYFIYGSFLGDVTIAERGLTVLIFELAATAVSLAAFMIKKP